MGKYGEAALKAVNLIEERKVVAPMQAWQIATIEIFGESTSSQSKGCPKSTFLGLCEEGLVRGISQGNYSNRVNSKNKAYGIKAVQLLKQNPSLSKDVNELWKKVLAGEFKQHNAQMDVVISLWKSNLVI